MFAYVQYLKTLKSVLQQLNTENKYLLLVAQNSDFDVAQIPVSSQVVGAIFPRLIFGNETYDSGYILAKMTPNTSAFFVEDMERGFEVENLDILNSYVVIVDGHSSKISYFLENFFAHVSESCRIMGGGAGKVYINQEPVIFKNNTIYKDAALVVGSYDYTGVGVRHGWEEIRGPFIVTHAKDRSIEKINYIDAFSFYKNVIKEDIGLWISEENFLEIAKNYPFGITRYSREFIVRDPVCTDGKILGLVGEIESNSIVSILKGNVDNLLEAAKQASVESLENKQDKKEPNQLLVIDCISRYLFLENDFQRELQNIQDASESNIPVWGVLSLGEIASANQENIEYLNKTCVVGSL